MSEEYESFEIDGKLLKPVIHKSDTPSDVKQRAIDLAVESMTKFNIEKDMAEYMKKKFDDELIEGWQCVIGKDFAVSLSHESKNFLFFSIEKTYFLLFKI
jgi:dynein light chain LC8-type